MCRKGLLAVCFVLTLSFSSEAWPGIFAWTDGAVDNSSWCDGDNWNQGGDAPGPGDTAVMATPERGPIIGTEICGDVTIGIMQGPSWAVSTDQVMDINTSGTVSVGAWVRDEDGTGMCTININGTPTITIGGDYWCLPDHGVGIINISGDPNIIIGDGDLRGADGAGSFIVNMSGGRVELGDDMSWGDNGGGELNLSGGDIIIGGNLAFGSLRGSALITLNMTGGSISIADAWECPSNKDRAGAVTVNLDAGVIECNEFVHGSMIEGQPSYTDDWLLDIEQGMLKIAGDVKAAIDANVAAGQITAYGGEGTVLVQLIDGNTVVTAFPADPNTATSPYPPNRSRLIDPNVVCIWTAGIRATSHDVYFGTDFNDVNSATTSDSVYQDNIGPNQWDPCGAGPLDELTTYYWRIDEQNGGTFKGRVWRFTTSGPLVDPNMLAWYKFDERSPNAVAHDSSGYGNHGPIGLDDEKEVQEPTWDPDGYDGGCLVFNDDMVVQPPGTLLSNIGAGVTFSVWLKDAEEDSENWIFDAGGGQGAPRHLTASVPHSGSDVYWRAGNDTNDVCVWTDANPAEWMGYWRHFAFVKDESAGNMKIYYEGELVAEQTGVSVGTLADIQVYALKIGTAAWTNFDYEGAMDEFRFYDRALSAIEIETLFRGELGPAWGPDPADGSIDVPRDVVLSWSPGKYGQALSAHDVYFGTSFNDVNDANTTETLDVYQGSQDLDANSYTPGVLELNTTYYWRVDEVNDPCLWKGPIWQFTTANFIIVDDFESYDNDTNRIYDTWIDGVENDTGSGIDLGVKPWSPVHSGRQSMLYTYSNNWNLGPGYCSEVELPFDPSRDFSEVGAKVLTLYFYGDPDNDIDDTEQLYVGLGGSYAQVNYPDMNDVKRAGWTEWNIEITDFAGVDPCAVTSLFIGSGARGSEVEGGFGIAWFDDIRLYPARCIPEYGPSADFSGDCIVSWPDVKIMGAQWLRTDANLNPVVAPGPGPVGHWRLDGDATDSSGNTNHGSAEGTYAWISGRIGSGAIEFGDDGGRVLVPDAAVLRPADEITVAAWINYLTAPDYSARVAVKGTDTGDHENFAMQVTSEDEFSWFVRDINTTLHGTDSTDELGHNEWIHLAGTYDGNAVTCYVNGQVSSSSTAGAITLLQDTNDLAIADRADANDRSFIGSVDDVQLYNYALSTAQVAYLATQGTGYLALGSQVNVYDAEPQGRQAVNLRDLAVLLEMWLVEKLWPE